MSSCRVYLIRRRRKLPSGKRATYWYLRWTGSDGRWYSESLGRADRVTAAEVKRLRDVKQTAIGSGRVRRDRPRRMTLAAFLDLDHEIVAPDVRGSTLVEHGFAARHARDALGDDTPLASIGWADVARIKQHMAEPDPKTGRCRRPATIRKTLVILRAMFNRAQRQGFVESNPFAELGLPKVESRPKKIFSRHEIVAMMRVDCDLWWRAFVRLAATSGLRLNELLNLRWADVDLAELTVTVCPKRSTTFTAGGRDFRTWTWSPKAKASRRTIPIPENTARLLRRLRLRMGASPFVFVTLNRLAALSSRVGRDGNLPTKFEIVPNVNNRFRKLQIAARAWLAEQRGIAIEEVVWPLGSVHDLRRTFCTKMADAVPMHVLRTWAGHSDIQTTADFYLEVSGDVADRGRAAMGVA